MGSDRNLLDVYTRSKKVGQFTNTTFDDFKGQLFLPMWIKVFNIVGQCSGILVTAIALFQLWFYFIVPGRNAAVQNDVWQAHPWHPPKRVNWVLWILVLPVVFSVEAMRANIKIWSIMNGTA